ncbi:MAG: hypothetical protein ACI3W6_04965 [Clostridia bacterium]
MVAVIQFLSAALPWILCGIAVAVICVGMNRKKSKEKEEALEKRMALGTSLGLLFGVALNSLGLWENGGIGIALGPLWGMALATLYRDGVSEEKGKGTSLYSRDEDKSG